MRKASSLLRWEINPIIVKELRSRMRGGRAFATLTGALLILAVCIYALYRMALVATQYSGTPLSPQIGQTLFAGLAFLELMLIAAITPAVTASAISGEQEKQTYEMLLTTPLHPASILWGKLISAMGYVFILIFAAVPLASLVFVFGGVAPREMVKAIFVLTLIALMFGVIGLFMSALFGRTGRAVAASYMLVALMLFAPMFAAFFTSVLRQGDPPRWLLIPSPISALGSALSPSVNMNNLSSMFWMLGNPLYWILGGSAISFDSIPRPIYHYSLPIYALLTLLLYLLATRLVRPVQRWRLEWAEILVGVVLLLGFVGLVTLGYASTATRYENFLLNQPAAPTPATFTIEPLP